PSITESPDPQSVLFLACGGLHHARGQQLSCPIESVLDNCVGRCVSRSFDEIAGSVGYLADHGKLSDVTHDTFRGILSGSRDGLLENVSRSRIDEPLHRLAGDGDSAEQ